MAKKDDDILTLIEEKESLKERVEVCSICYCDLSTYNYLHT